MPDVVGSAQWAAGFFDGEGHISIAARGRRYHSLTVSAANTDRRPLEQLVELFGGKILDQPKANRWRLCFSWRLCGEEAIAFLRAVRPYLVVKGEDADTAFAFYATVQRGPGVPRARVSDALVAERELLRRDLLVRHRGLH
jgi:hypothetical protein